jgi:hypothetical protein
MNILFPVDRLPSLLHLKYPHTPAQRHLIFLATKNPARAPTLPGPSFEAATATRLVCAVSREHRLEAAGREDGKRCDARYSEDKCRLKKAAALRTPHIKIKTPALRSKAKSPGGPSGTAAFLFRLTLVRLSLLRRP